jgi:hypothetical protein
MKYVQAVVDNSSAFLAWLLALFGLLSLLHVVSLSDDQTNGVMLFAGATIGLVAIFLSVAKRQVVSRVGNDGVIRAGQAADAATGSPTPVMVNPDGTLVPQVTVRADLATADDGDR